MNSMATHVSIAFASGVVVETLYTLNVLLIGERRGVFAGVLAALWGVAFLVGVNESFHTWIAAAAWCVGLGVGTALGVAAKRRWEKSGTE